MMIVLAALVTALALASLAVSVYSLLTAHKLFHAAKVLTNPFAQSALALSKPQNLTTTPSPWSCRL